MPSQNNPGRQYDKQHATTVVATARIEANRFVGYDGTHATSAGGVHDSQGISEFAADIGEATSVVTGYSYLVQLGTGANVAFGDLLKPAADGSGTAIVGDGAEYCARALGAGVAGDLIEVEIDQHMHAAAGGA
ncbi:DUF2190 domain-containing protein [Burkholderia gladioli]|uniref:DUF2190 domain-containing protein n=1 Tax=Burkholderia gladioli TaxID=28095 RepID=UPI000CDA7957|nr:DUF2190 domain-containing protein [Burkholderia gladioli]POS08033.1 DUF2190 domain-containing protein [Burkholderia gladioli]